MRLVHAAGYALGEAPVWDAATSTWLLVDIVTGTVLRLDAAGTPISSFAVGQQISAAWPMSDGRVLIAGERRLYACSPDGTGLTEFGPELVTQPDLQLNDGKADAAGRFWVGSRDRTRSSRGELFCVEPDGTARTVLSGIIVSNGLGWSPDGTTFYYVDSLAYELRAYDFDVRTGELGPARVLVAFDAADGLPDGLAVAADGVIHLAMFGGSCIRRISPAGEFLDSLEMPVPNVTSCAFGGPKGSDLLVTTGRYRMDEAGLAAFPDSGALYLLDANVVGVPVGAFG